VCDGAGLRHKDKIPASAMEFTLLSRLVDK
jgi:hypothetical protein